MPRTWTAEQRAEASRNRKEAWAQKQQLKQMTQFVAEPGAIPEEMIASLGKPGKIIAVPNDHLDLLKWVARSIAVKNTYGKKMDTKCLLCPISRLHREPCRHGDIWRLAGQ